MASTIQLSPQYLLNLSKHIQTLNTFHQQQNMPSFSQQYKHYLQQTFINLNDHLVLFQKDTIMVQSALINTKMQLNLFLLEKFASLLLKQAVPLAQIVAFITIQLKQFSQNAQNLLIQQRKRKIQMKQQKTQVILNNLKDQILTKRDYVKQLQQRIHQLQQQNLDLISKRIQRTKEKVCDTLSKTKSIQKSLSPYIPLINQNSLQLTISPQQVSKLKKQISSAHTKLSLKQVEEEVIEILQAKKRQENIKNDKNKVSFNNYLKTYFRNKFGIPTLAEEMLINFKDALIFFNKNTDKSLFTMFLKMLSEQCEQSYFDTWKALQDKLIHKMKRYLHEKQKISLDSLDRMYSITSNANEQRSDILLNQNDVKIILINIYKQRQVQSLQMILNQIIRKSAPIQIQQNYNSLSLLRSTPNISQIGSKKLLNQILLYQLQKHIFSISLLTKLFHKQCNQQRLISYQGLETIVLGLEVAEHTYIKFFTKHYQLLRNRLFTYTETVQIIVNQMKIKQFNSNKANYK